MKIVSLNADLVRADSAVAEFRIRLALDGTEPCVVKGRLVGPRCQGVTTVEVAYPLEPVEPNGGTATLRGVVPEPNLWTPETPFRYAVEVELWVGDVKTEGRGFVIVFKDK